MPIRRLPTPAGSPSIRSSTPGSSSSSVGGRGTSRAPSGSTASPPRSRARRSARRCCSRSCSGRRRGRRARSRRTSPIRSETCSCSPPSSASSPCPGGASSARGSSSGSGSSRRRSQTASTCSSSTRTRRAPTWTSSGPRPSLLIAAAGWVAARDEPGLQMEGRPLLAVPALCALVGIGILVIDHFSRVNVVAVALAATTLLMVLLRLAFTFRENAQLYALTRHESVTDPLTGLGNRRKLLSDLERVLGVDRPPRTLLVIFDLNGFKLYNDRFGHPAGDALLQRLAERFSAVPGPTGDAYRLGGDEFCVVVPLASDGAESVVQAGSAALSERGEGFEVTASFGSAVLPAEAGDVSRALAVADERLYAQKHHRRLERDPTVRGFLEGLADPGARPARAPRRRGRALGRRRRAARPHRHRARRALPGGTAPRSRQARGSRGDPQQARAARRARVGVHPPAHGRRRADPSGIPGLPGGRLDRSLEPRELGRDRAIRTGCPGTRSRSRRGSSAPATRSPP